MLHCTCNYFHALITKLGARQWTNTSSRNAIFWADNWTITVSNNYSIFILMIFHLPAILLETCHSHLHRTLCGIRVQYMYMYVYVRIETYCKHTFSTNRYKLYSFWGNEVQGLIHVGDFVEAHFTTVRMWELLTRDHLKEGHEFQTIAEVCLDLLYLSVRLPQVRVAPCCKCLESER